MSVSLLYLEPPPTYITSHPQTPFLEAEHLEDSYLAQAGGLGSLD